MMNAHSRPVNVAKDTRAKTLPTMVGSVLTANLTDLTKAHMPFPNALQCALLQRSSQAHLTNAIDTGGKKSIEELWDMTQP